MPEPDPPPPRGLTPVPGAGVQTLQGAILVGIVLYFGRDLLIPLVLAVLLAFVLAPVVRALRRLQVPRVPGVLVAGALAGALILGTFTVMGRQASLLAASLPVYQDAIGRKLTGLRDAGFLVERIVSSLQAMGRSAAPAAAPPITGQAPLPVEIHAPDPTALQMLRSVAEPLLAPLATAGIVTILVIFILLYREDLRDRLLRLAGARDLHRTMAAMDDAAWRLSRFFLAQTAMNAGFGVYIGVALWALGIPNPVLCGIIAALMRFVPFLGSFVAAGVPALLALAVDPGWATLLWVVALFAVSEVAMGQMFEPLVFGHSTGLSPIAVIAAATFWTWLWGPIGLLLAVPLTVCLVVLGRHVDRLEFLEVMLGDQPPLDPEEAFYQRALSGDADALAEQAERALKERPLSAVLDAVMLPALRLAQEDAQRDALAPERRQVFQRSIEVLLEDLEEAEDPPGAAPAAPLPASWQVPGAILCLPGRGPFDALAAVMLGQVLRRRGFGVQTGGVAVGPAAPPRLLCLCLIEGGCSGATARYLLRRARRRLPGVPALALAWAPEGGGVAAAALRAEAVPVTLAASMAEAVALATEQAGALATPAATLTAPAPRPELPPLAAAAAPAG